MRPVVGTGHHTAAVRMHQHELVLVGMRGESAGPGDIAVDIHAAGVGQAARAQHLAGDQDHVGPVGQDHDVAVLQHHVVELAVGVDGDVAGRLDVLGLGDELGDQGGLGRRQLGRRIGRRR